ncbi:hypothetical protein VTJ04DRAFT_5210 [Mycothermus thermophilus]|uniref:uncharacterized protein n=1 Tax=Humicola insolens TaxID=85995 RepID=UPI003743FB19
MAPLMSQVQIRSNPIRSKPQVQLGHHLGSAAACNQPTPQQPHPLKHEIVIAVTRLFPPHDTRCLKTPSPRSCSRKGKGRGEENDNRNKDKGCNACNQKTRLALSIQIAIHAAAPSPECRSCLLVIHLSHVCRDAATPPLCMRPCPLLNLS